MDVGSLPELKGEPLGVLRDLAPETARAAPQVGRDAFYRALFENPELVCFVVAVRPDGGFVFADANAAGARFSRVPWHDLPGRTPRDGLVPEVAEILEADLERCVGSGRPLGGERSVDLPQGRTCWTVSLTPVVDRRGRVRHVIGLARIIPADLRPAAGPDRNAALVESLRQAAPGLFYLFDLSLRRFRFVAGQMSRPLGHPPSELEEMLDPVGRLCHPDDCARVDKHLARLVRLDDREIATLDCRMRHRDGHFLHFAHRHMVFSRDPDGSVRMIFGTANDVTDQQLMREEVNGLSERLLTVALDERRRIARDLHDGTGQHIVAAEMALARIQTSSADAVRGRREARALSQSLGEVMTCLKEAESDIRILSYLMHPPDLLNWGLVRTLETYASGFGRRAGLAVELEIDERADTLPQRIALPLLRCCQEALTNVYRHARARSVRVVLALGDEKVSLTVADDGVGLDDVDAILDAARGVGLAGMRERITRLGGAFDLRSEGGAILAVEVPLERAGAP